MATTRQEILERFGLVAKAAAGHPRFRVWLNEPIEDGELTVVTNPYSGITRDELETRRKFVEDAIREKLERSIP